MNVLLLLGALALATPALGQNQTPAADLRDRDPGPEEFVQSSMAGLQFVIEASRIATEKPVDERTQDLAETLRDAHQGLARDLVAKMKLARVPVGDGIERMIEEGFQTSADAVALDETLSRELDALRDERAAFRLEEYEDDRTIVEQGDSDIDLPQVLDESDGEGPNLERRYLRLMSVARESAIRWWTAYAERSETPAVRDFAGDALRNIRSLAAEIAEVRA